MSDFQTYKNDALIKLEQTIDLQSLQCSDAYLLVDDEIKKMQAIMPEDPDWALVLENGLEILSTQGKHLKIITYVIAALYQLHGLSGLLFGLEILAEVLAQEQDEILPNGKRGKSRQAMLVWLAKFVGNCREDDFSKLSNNELSDVEEHKEMFRTWHEAYLPGGDDIAITALYDLFINQQARSQEVALQKEAEDQKRLEATARVAAEKEEADRLKAEELASQAESEGAEVIELNAMNHEPKPGPLFDDEFDPFAEDDLPEDLS